MEIIVENKAKRQSYKKNSDDKVGETRINTLGSKMWIIEYVTTNNVTVQFQNEYVTNTTYPAFLNGNVKNPYDPSIYGCGYLGEGNYKTKTNGQSSPQYESWRSMMRRCYDKKIHKSFPTYIGCSVCSEWHNFQTFAKWYDENYYKIGEERMCLDKDILVKGNKVYSPEVCVFTPNNINILFTKSDSRRGDYPIGVKKERGNRYSAHCNRAGHPRKNIGAYNTPEEAFENYKIYKETHIKEVADMYKDKIPYSLYIALYSYEVSIGD